MFFYFRFFFGDRPSLSVWNEKFLADILIKESSTFVNHFVSNREVVLLIITLLTL